MIQETKHRSEMQLRGNYVLLTADSLRLLLPQHEVGAAEYLEGALEPSAQPGLLQLQGVPGERRFAALSARMSLLPNCPPDRFLVSSLGEGNGAGEVESGLGWCWNEMKILIDVDLRAQPLPAVLLARHAPVDCYVELDGLLAYPCSADRLQAYALAQGN